MSVALLRIPGISAWIMKIDERELLIIGTAKEGLIKQHTAEKAVDWLVEALKNIASRNI